jgi:hypothetical protein
VHQPSIEFVWVFETRVYSGSDGVLVCVPVTVKSALGKSVSLSRRRS